MEDKQEFYFLNEEMNSVIISVNEIKKQKDCIKTEELNIFEINDNNNDIISVKSMNKTKKRLRKDIQQTW